MKQFRVMKSYTGKFQKCEVEVVADTKEELLEETTWADDFAKKELDRMVEYVAKYDDKRETGIVPTPAPKAPEKATANQWACIKKNETKAKMVAEELGITLDDNLSKANAYKVITKLVNKQ